MPALLAPLTRAVTYTRWLHMVLGSLIAIITTFVYPGWIDPTAGDWAVVPLVPVPLLLVAALIPSIRLAEGLQAQVMLLPGPHARVRGGGATERVDDIVAAPSASWRDRGRTAVWLVLRLEVGCAVAAATTQMLAMSLDLVTAATGAPPSQAAVLHLEGGHWTYGLLSPVPAIVLVYLMAGAGVLMTTAARRLLGPSPAERLAALEARTELLLERNRIARELHDSIGHALTVAVVQAGAARAAGSSEFTDRALDAIEGTGRAALEDLDRVLRVLRDPSPPASGQPTLADAHGLLDSARAAGTDVQAAITGPLGGIPAPVSREGYRILQESLTNVLRHARGAPVRLRMTVDDALLEIDVRNPLPVPSGVRDVGAGSGLRGIRERAALLGGRATAGPEDSEWRVRVELPLGQGLVRGPVGAGRDRDLGPGDPPG
ncbi:two-component sensor histidine kinase [Streptomyces triticagri]|uniref:histidine kinase n=1 Tax=Streptomyces triticagri TaxID=2293568 RepID=A0A372M3Z6_9ACTN|nr:histidine kinase [Streptomyces triticagri]RFU85668.1 two-component sensor histidine kinase [Streptomyces triticagri]